MKINRKFNVIFVAIIMFLLSVRNVYAIDFSVEEEQTDLFFNCNASNSCVPLCIYDSDRAMISYYYANVSDSSNGTGWGFSYKTNDHWDGHMFRRTNVYYYIDSLIPKTDVYSADEYKTNGHELVDWSSSDLYKNLQSSFTCPKYMAYDAGENIDVDIPGLNILPLPFAIGEANELCFSTKMGACESLDDGFVDDYDGTNFKGSAALNLKFSLIDSINTVNSEVYDRLRLDDSTPTEKMEFLVKLDSNVKFLSSLSPEENAKNNCHYVESKVKDDGGVSYAQSIMSSDYVTNNYFADLDRTYSRVTDDLSYSALLRYPEIFTYDIQKNMLIDGNKNYRSDQFKKVDGLLENNIYQSLKYVSDVCSTVGVDIKVDEPGIRSTVEKNYDLMRFNDPYIDFEEQFNCSDIFTEEITDLIGTGYFILEMAGLAIMVIFSALDYVKVFLNDNADSLKKTNGNLLKRLIIVVILFLLPGIVNFALRVFNVENVKGTDEKNRLCIRISNK